MPSTLVDLARRVAAQAPVADELAVLVELDEDEAQDAHGRGNAAELEDLDAHVPAAVGAVEADHGRHAAARELLHLLASGADDARRTDAPARARAFVGLLGAARAPPGRALLLGGVGLLGGGVRLRGIALGGSLLVFRLRLLELVRLLGGGLLLRRGLLLVGVSVALRTPAVPAVGGAAALAALAPVRRALGGGAVAVVCLPFARARPRRLLLVLGVAPFLLRF